ncbi:small-conductance mechanosensitive channel [Sphingomonas naasensis]|uniref:Mechanosensitive ion channel n=1 Tax=Sphingomonas naasensis TaxID=1344951 RepID=A0A4S1WJF2_9SPHN|nr:mechanosensitive ion channel domain-containing protein [Sphingomonas naasensis]NIJ21836.1 small-conductance mechanosensitive channel [Sphingomonas naasensis]TGX42465.1 mechanosensitive ion channel [Sphingomonas naasensis]
MERLGAWLAGHNLPGTAELTEAAIATGLAALALFLGWLAGRHIGARIAAAWAEHVNGNAATFHLRVCAIVRWGVVAILLALAAVSWPWMALPALVIGLVEGLAGAMLVAALLRGLNLPRWAAWTLGALAFTAILSHAIGGFSVIEVTLDRVGIQVGQRRFSLLSALTIGITVLLLFAGVRLTNKLLGHSIGNARGFDPTQKLLVQKLAGIAVVILAFFIGVDLLEIDLTAFAVFSGAFGLAIGFGLQKTIGNLIAGIILLMDRSIKPGDVIVVGDSFGWVNKIGVRAVSVVTRDGKEHLIPNENLMTQEVENWSYTDRNVRVRIPVTVAYDCDLKLAQELMLRAAAESPRVLNNPKTNVWLMAFGQTGVEHEILAWISDPESGVGNVRSDVLNRLWLLFKEHGIAVPYPVRDVRVREWPTTGG